MAIDSGKPKNCGTRAPASGSSAEVNHRGGLRLDTLLAGDPEQRLGR
ncbi:MAG: hypothetical protein IPH80_33730 [Myxococcales bacterium]|nr:hypothetical protein [Myxococcales bacterium]